MILLSIVHWSSLPEPSFYYYNLASKAGLELMQCSHIISRHNQKCHTNQWQCMSDLNRKLLRFSIGLYGTSSCDVIWCQQSIQQQYYGVVVWLLWLHCATVVIVLLIIFSSHFYFSLFFLSTFFVSSLFLPPSPFFSLLSSSPLPLPFSLSSLPLPLPFSPPIPPSL